MLQDCDYEGIFSYLKWNLSITVHSVKHCMTHSLIAAEMKASIKCGFIGKYECIVSLLSLF